MVEASSSSPGVELLPPDVRQTIRVLVVDDEETLVETCRTVLESEGYDVEALRRGDEALTRLKRRPYDVLLVDYYMSKVAGRELMEAALETNPGCLVVVMTGNPSVESSLQALRAGAWDYLPKPFSATHLQILFGRASHAVIVARESSDAAAAETSEGARPSGSDEPAILGTSAVFRKVMKLAEQVASTDASVLITGESGTGKEMIAQFIHRHSRRRSRELVAVNCAALPEALLESEMFGHVKGAFTGAVGDKTGLLEVAHGGTLFLDELTEMPVSIQAKFLRVLQDGVVRRLGSAKTDAVVNVRVIAAANKDPVRAVEAGTLRKDLFYRLRVVPIHIPPLRERVDDIPILAEYFLDYYWQLYRGGEPAPTLAPEAMDLLRAREWPGNVRALRNAMEHAVVLLGDERTVGPQSIPEFDEPGSEEDSLTLGGSSISLSGEYREARDRVLAEFEMGYLARVVRRASGKMSDAAKIAGVDRTTLYRLMQKHDVDRKDFFSDS
jgi:DNA-binding NtrC family response regulator